MKCAQVRRGFTLVELLVTMGVIAIVTALMVGGITVALRKGERARAVSDMNAIVAAIKAYRAEYALWPSPRDNGWNDRPYGSKNQSGSDNRYNNEVMDVLRAVPGPFNVGNSNNTRRIVFLEVSPSSMSGTDQRSTPSTYTESEGYFLDPWGEPYVIFMDTDFDGELGMSGLEEVWAPTPDAAKRDLQALANVQATAVGGVVPSLEVGVLSYGATPGTTNSTIFSWGVR